MIHRVYVHFETNGAPYRGCWSWLPQFWPTWLFLTDNIISDAKLFMKELWVKEYECDSKLDDKILKEWNQISENLKVIPLHPFPRHMCVNAEIKGGVMYSLLCFVMPLQRHMPQLHNIYINPLSLIYVDADITSSMILTPSHFLSFHSWYVTPNLVDETDPEFKASKRVSTSQQLLKIWKCGQKRLNQFWCLWKMTIYLL